MPYKSEKSKIQGTKYDRRIKLSDDDREYIKFLRENDELSYSKLATMFKVSKRTIIFVLNPQKKEKCMEQRRLRGKDGRYYEKEYQTNAIKETRRYKQKLYLEGLIK